MTKPNKDPHQTDKKTHPVQPDDIAKQQQREKAEEEEVVGRHKNDGQKGHKGRR